MVMLRRLLLIPAFASAGCAISKPPLPSLVRAGVGAAGECTLTLNGQALSPGELAQTLKASGAREVHIVGADTAVPHRCLEPAVTALQRARVPIRVGFISEPPAAAYKASPPQR